VNYGPRGAKWRCTRPVIVLSSKVSKFFPVIGKTNYCGRSSGPKYPLFNSSDWQQACTAYADEVAREEACLDSIPSPAAPLRNLSLTRE
jgi:hypothetical protein